MWYNSARGRIPTTAERRDCCCKCEEEMCKYMYLSFEIAVGPARIIYSRAHAHVGEGHLVHIVGGIYSDS